ncbi:MAG: hypothetical protein DRG78_21270 [Epsilonproteobacteria bacterium]|nr:MAG: hypothetical protein DRG78_21270 [Campylobacterota bacterium]
MAKIINQPTRMCISCRKKDTQQNLLRLQCVDGSLESFCGSGRSFYLCQECLNQEKKLSKALMRQCKSGEKDKFMNRLKEIITDDRKS